jgi:hypothetical protein
VFGQAEAGGSGIVSRRVTGQSGSDTFVMKVPNNKVCRSSCFCQLILLLKFRMVCDERLFSGWSGNR